ncbi:hypothetical protein Tco_0812667 [Tanacetum coccineum]
MMNTKCSHSKGDMKVEAKSSSSGSYGKFIEVGKNMIKCLAILDMLNAPLEGKPRKRSEQQDEDAGTARDHEDDDEYNDTSDNAHDEGSDDHEDDDKNDETSDNVHDEEADGYDTKTEEDHSNYEDEDTEDHMNNVGDVVDDHSSDSHKYESDDEVDMLRSVVAYVGCKRSLSILLTRVAILELWKYDALVGFGFSGCFRIATEVATNIRKSQMPDDSSDTSSVRPVEGCRETRRESKDYGNELGSSLSTWPRHEARHHTTEVRHGQKQVPQAKDPRDGRRRQKKTGKQPVVDLDEDNDDDDEMASRRSITRWNNNEEILLAEAWIEHSQDANIGKDQHEDVYWNLIMNDFNSRTTAPPRTKNMMTGKWTRMHGDCQRFNGIYKHLNRKSGESDVDLVENAKTIYIDRYGKKILYPHVWSILKNYPKWNAAKPIDEDNLQELFGPDQRERPVGKQRAKKKQKTIETTSVGGAPEGALGGVNRSLYRHLFIRIIDVNVMLMQKRTRRKEKKN